MGADRITTVTIVGSGPSLLQLTAGDFQPGAVITLNFAALAVRKLHLDNPLYLMQKDGCVQHTSKSRVPLRCRCPNRRKPMIPPVMPETVILSAAESPGCFRTYRKRIVVDVEREFGLPWHTMSAPVAVRIAHRMGAREIRMVGFDSRAGDVRRFDGARLVDKDNRGYVGAIRHIEAWAETVDVALTWHGAVSSA